MHRGKVSKLCYDQEYGTITTSAGQEAHFHKHCLWDVQFADLKEDQDVEFELQTSYKGFLAIEIRSYVPLTVNADPTQGALCQNLKK